MKKLLFTLALLLPAMLFAKEYRISSAAELSALKLSAGDEILFAAGRYADQALELKGEGTKEQPIILKAEKFGDVVLSGKSTLRYGGKFLEVHNLIFEDIDQTKGYDVVNFTVGKKISTDCRLYNSTIMVKKLGQSLDANTWVIMSGFRNTVERCTFDNKKNMQPILIVTFEKDGPAPEHRIINNYFRRENSNLDNGGSKSKEDDDEGADGGRRNGQETIRIGTGPFSSQRGECVVEGNIFYRCDGEAEVVSNKSRANIYRGNLFLECRGALTLRQGGECLVEGNYFIGSGRADTGGLRVAGDKHTIRDNYFEGLAGEKYFTAICLIKGMLQKDASKPIPVYHYPPVEGAVIENNTIVSCKNGINVCYGANDTQNLPVVNTVIRNNIIYNDNISNVDIICYPKPKCDIKWIENTIYGGHYQGVTAKEIPMTKAKPTLPAVKDNVEKIKNNCGTRAL